MTTRIIIAIALLVAMYKQQQGCLQSEQKKNKLDKQNKPKCILISKRENRKIIPCLMMSLIITLFTSGVLVRTIRAIITPIMKNQSNQVSHCEHCKSRWNSSFVIFIAAVVVEVVVAVIALRGKRKVVVAAVPVASPSFCWCHTELHTLNPKP